MQYVENNTLSQYLEFERPSHDLAAKWILALAYNISYTHFRHVIIGDIASRNVLLDKDKSVKLCDFSDSDLIPLDVDIEKAEDNGASTSADIFQFGSLVYEILTGQPCKYGLFANEEIEQQRKVNEVTMNREPEATLPHLDRLPATETLALS